MAERRVATSCGTSAHGVQLVRLRDTIQAQILRVGHALVFFRGKGEYWRSKHDSYVCMTIDEGAA